MLEACFLIKYINIEAYQKNMLKMLRFHILVIFLMNLSMFEFESNGEQDSISSEKNRNLQRFTPFNIDAIEKFYQTFKSVSLLVRFQI